MAAETFNLSEHRGEVTVGRDRDECQSVVTRYRAQSSTAAGYKGGVITEVGASELPIQASKIRRLFDQAKKLGYKDSFGHMAHYVAHVRSLVRANGSPAPAERTIRSLPLDPLSGSRISPVVAGAICMKPQPLLTERQAGMLAVLKDEVPGFAVLRRLTIRFQSLLRHHDEKRLEQWLTDAKGCGIPAVVNFARTLMVDIQAVRNAVIESWSNGQTEGQINRLKMLKRAMFGRAHTELLRVRLLPIDEITDHRVCG